MATHHPTETLDWLSRARPPRGREEVPVQISRLLHVVDVPTVRA
jgi:hypothetical protein